MKVAEFKNGGSIYFADLEDFNVSRKPTSPFYDSETCGALKAYCLTIEHPNLPSRAWLTFPYEEEQQFEVQEVCKEFLSLIQGGATLSDAARQVKGKYFASKDFGELFEEYSNCSFDIRLS
jgi:hypothetical protein